MAGAPHPKPARREKAPRKPLRTRPKPALTAAEREARLRFKTNVHALDGGACVAHDDPADCDGDLQAAHVISQQHLRKAGRHDLLWDPAGGFSACYRAHRRHDNRVEPLPVGRLPRRCVTFARSHGFGDILSRYYPAA